MPSPVGGYPISSGGGGGGPSRQKAARTAARQWRRQAERHMLHAQRVVSDKKMTVERVSALSSLPSPPSVQRTASVAASFDTSGLHADDGEDERVDDRPISKLPRRLEGHHDGSAGLEPSPPLRRRGRHHRTITHDRRAAALMAASRQVWRHPSVLDAGDAALSKRRSSDPVAMMQGVAKAAPRGSRGGVRRGQQQQQRRQLLLRRSGTALAVRSSSSSSAASRSPSSPPLLSSSSSMWRKQLSLSPEGGGWGLLQGQRVGELPRGVQQQRLCDTLAERWRREDAARQQPPPPQKQGMSSEIRSRSSEDVSRQLGFGRANGQSRKSNVRHGRSYHDLARMYGNTTPELQPMATKST
jgi:hypothetical protein